MLQEVVQAAPAEVRISGSAIATVFGVVSTIALAGIAAFKTLGMKRAPAAGRRVEDGFTDHDRAAVLQQAIKVDRLTELMVLLTQTIQQQSETQRQLSNVSGQQALLLQTIILKIDDCFPDPKK